MCGDCREIAPQRWWTSVGPNHYSCPIPGIRIDMSNVRTMTIELTETQVADLQAAVDAGGYATTDAIVQEAISDWQVRHALNEEDVQRLRALWDEGRADGATQPFDIERILASAYARKTRSVAE
jgi:antitoxin ParD1/3/4